MELKKSVKFFFKSKKLEKNSPKLSKPQNWGKMTCTMVPNKECETFNGLHFPKILKSTRGNASN